MRKPFLQGSITVALKLVLLSSLLFLAIQNSSFAENAEVKSGDVYWSYEGTDGPDYWGELTQDYRTCSAGTQQSPIDLKAEVDVDLDVLEFDYEATPLNLVNNGHTVQINYAPGSTLTLDDQTYNLLQVHFHNPSEHRVKGHSYAMEAHLVHQNPETDDLAVIGIFLEPGDENSVLKPIWDNMPMAAGSVRAIVDTTINIDELLPADTEAYYRYFGSLTTPPCSEKVNWIVMKEPVKVSLQQVERLATAVGANARPIQVIGSRSVLY